MIGLDIAGIDVVALDISRPLEEQGGVVVEVNAAPGLRMHLDPSVGISRPVSDAIINTIFPEGDEGRIPRRRHGHQRQDHHHPLHRPHPQGQGFGRHDLHRRHLHRRPADRHWRLQRAERAPGQC